MYKIFLSEDFIIMQKDTHFPLQMNFTFHHFPLQMENVDK